MGMAASQARYLALTARKTNAEYEGQQINQARTALANQSANLFNRLLNMDVPNPPKTTDYTTLQYSYSDGENDSVLGSWQQLSKADPNYNYIVNHYYYTDLYTGSQKKLQNPEVTLGNISQTDITSNPDVTSVSLVPSSSGGFEVQITGTDGTVTAYVPVSSLVMTDKLQQSLRAFEKKTGIQGEGNPNLYAWQDESQYWHFISDSDITQDYATSYSVGNCPVKSVKAHLENGRWVIDSDSDEAEISQIIKDIHNTNLDNYLSFDAANDRVNYTGEGLYQFEMFGTKYFTTEADLMSALQSYDEYGKPIENQERLSYYNASYIKTKVEQTNQALLETDGNGRFKSVKFDDDSVVYSLNTETVTDEAAYQDAMNQYLYEKEKYEKTIADINAKTSIIQKEDRTLELRLKQLDTEQNALKTEMDAVKKVIKDNVDTTFKTFSD